MITYAFSVCSKSSFGENHHRCAQHVKAPMGQCRAKGAVVKHVPTIVGIHDRTWNVGGRVARGHGPTVTRLAAWRPWDWLGCCCRPKRGGWPLRTVVAALPSQIQGLRWQRQPATHWQVLIPSIHMHPHTYSYRYPVVPNYRISDTDNPQIILDRSRIYKRIRLVEKFGT